MGEDQFQKRLYFIAAVATLAGGGGGMLGFIGTMRIEPAFWPIVAIPIVAGGGFLLLLAGTFAYLSRKPKGWGKLLCVAGIPWIGFSAVSFLFRGEPGFEFNPLLVLPAIAGITLLVIGIALLAHGRIAH